MRLGMITSSYPRHAGDGAGSFVASLAHALADDGHSVFVLAPYDRDIPPSRPTGEPEAGAAGGAVSVRHFHYAPTRALHIAGYGRALHADTRLHRLAPLLMPSYSLAAVAQALAWHRRERFDVIHGHWAVPGGVLATLVGALAGVPVVLSLHGSDVFVIEHSALYAAAARAAFRRAACTVACSRDLRARAVALGLPESRAQVIPYGVDVARFGAAAPDQAASMRQRLGVPESVPLIGALGRLVHKKGFAHLIAALPQVLAAAPEAYCVIAGAGDLLPDLRALARRTGVAERVLFPGAIDWQETPAFYGACDVFALPSVVDERGNVDGLPNVLLEAMASRCAIVASRVAGIPDVLHDGQDGLLLPPGDSAALAEALLRLLADEVLRTRLGLAARASACRDYTWQGAARAYTQVYADALAGAAR